MGYQYAGVNPTTGIFQFVGAHGDTSAPETTDLKDIGNLLPSYYGGLTSTFTFKNWELMLFFEGRRQKGFNYGYYIYGEASPGTLGLGGLANLPVGFTDRWQMPGQNAAYERLTNDPSSPAASAVPYYLQSNAAITDASFIKLRTASLSYNLPTQFVKKTRLTAFKIFARGQNLFTITKYKGADPETQNIYVLPPVRVITGGIQVTF
jgi:hypothetical protein